MKQSEVGREQRGPETGRLIGIARLAQRSAGHRLGFHLRDLGRGRLDRRLTLGLEVLIHLRLIVRVTSLEVLGRVS